MNGPGQELLCANAYTTLRRFGRVKSQVAEV
jgi:hypothetical protein